MSITRLALPEGYEPFLKDLKERIRTAQIRAALAVNRELVLLYWSIGRDILARQREHGWGAKIIDRLAADLHTAFPEMTGLSPRNLKYMRALAEAYPDEQFVQQVVAQIPWGHNVRILDYVKHSTEREWYIRQTIQNGWSRNVLVHQIEGGLYRRQGQALTNFAALCRLLSRSWRSRSSRTLTISSSSPSPKKHASGSWSAPWPITFAISFWSSESALRSSAASIRSKWVARSFESIFCSTTCACAVSWCWTSR